MVWFATHWLPLLQSVGIIGGLLFTGWSIRQNTQARRLANLFEVAKSHRDIWSKLFGNVDLHGVLDSQRDCTALPVTVEEQVFSTLMIIHIGNLFTARRLNSLLPLEKLESDVFDFMSLPVPSAVWSAMKSYQNNDFVAFVDGILEGPQHSKAAVALDVSRHAKQTLRRARTLPE